MKQSLNTKIQNVDAELAYEIYEGFILKYSRRLAEIMQTEGFSDNASYYAGQIGVYKTKLEALDSLIDGFSVQK